MSEPQLTADFGAVLDANVLANFALCDLLLRLAETPRLYIPFWGEEILAETERTLTGKLGWPPKTAQGLLAEIRAHFPECLVAYPPELLQAFTNDPKDRHVLAAAVRSKSEVIVTLNLRHFRAADLAPWGVEAQHPQEFLLSLYDLNQSVVLARLIEAVEGRREDLPQRLGRLKKTVPAFAEQVAADLFISL
jgi:predicted nucleic acid-binding protein